MVRGRGSVHLSRRAVWRGDATCGLSRSARLRPDRFFAGGNVPVVTFFVETRWGGSEDSPSAERMREILSELDAVDPEHPDTWLTHESGWTLSAHETGLLVFENTDTDAPPRHMRGVPRARTLELWLKLASGQLSEVENEPWFPGYGVEPLTDVQRTEREARLRDIDREFYDSLGIERDEPQCEEAGCSRGAVRASLFCRVHQFENVCGRPCPFTH
jgi:hypothetical protein